MSAKQFKIRGRKKKLKKIFLKSLFAVILFAAINGLFYLPKFRIKNIIINGDLLYKSELETKIKEILNDKIFLILPADNIFLLRKKYIAQQIIEKTPLIKFVRFNRGFPNSLKVEIEERQKISLWCASILDFQFQNAADKNCFFIDENGVAFDYGAADSMSKLPIFINLEIVSSQTASTSLNDYSSKINLGALVIEKKLLQSFLEFIKNAENVLQLKTERIVLEKNIYKIFFKNNFTPLETHTKTPRNQEFKAEPPYGSPSIITEDSAKFLTGFILLDAQTDFQNGFENLKLILNSQEIMGRNLEYIDLRFKSKVFFK